MMKFGWANICFLVSYDVMYWHTRNNDNNRLLSAIWFSMWVEIDSKYDPKGPGASVFSILLSLSVLPSQSSSQFL